MNKGWILGLLAITSLAVAGLGLANFAHRERDYSSLPTAKVRRGTLRLIIEETTKLESADNYEVRSEASGKNAITWLIESGTYVQPGDLLATIDSLKLEDQIHEQSKHAFNSQASAERLEAEAVAARLRIEEYREGRYKSELRRLQKELAVIEANLTTSKNLLKHAKSMQEKGYVSELEVDDREFGVTVGKLLVTGKKNEIDTLKNFTREGELVRLEGELRAISENFNAERERALMTAKVRDRAVGELKDCEIRAKRAGLVIRLEKQEWEEAPIDAGTEVWGTQTILLMPDLSKMQLKLGIHESMIDRIHVGQEAVVTLAHRTLRGKVAQVAPVARSSGWWSGTAVLYDTFIELPSVEGLLPGVSAEVELIVEEHKDALLIPVDAVLDSHLGYACWVLTPEGPERRSIEVSDTDDLYIVVTTGLSEGERVIQKPISNVEEARLEAALSFIKE